MDGRTDGSWTDGLTDLAAHALRVNLRIKDTSLIRTRSWGPQGVRNIEVPLYNKFEFTCSKFEFTSSKFEFTSSKFEFTCSKFEFTCLALVCMVDLNAAS